MKTEAQIGRYLTSASEIGRSIRRSAHDEVRVRHDRQPSGRRRVRMIHARGLVQVFHTGKGKKKREVRAVDGVDLDVAEGGEVVGFLGPNGAGKTTTLRMLTTLLRPTAGTATVNGYDVVEDPVSVRRSIGYVSQPVARSARRRRATRSSTTGCCTGCREPRRPGEARRCSRNCSSTACGNGCPRTCPGGAEAAPRHRDGPRPRTVAGLPR